MTETVEVLIITALEEESAAVRAVDEGAAGAWSPRKDKDGFAYFVRCFNTPRGKLRVGLARAVARGAASAAMAAARLVDDLQPQCLAMCGIFAGHPEKVSLGDVVVAEKVYQYDDGNLHVWNDKDGVQQQEFHSEMTTYNLDPRWKMAAQDFPVAEIETALGTRPPSMGCQEQWLLQLLDQGYAKPTRHPDRPNQCPHWTRVVQTLRDKKLIKSRGLALTNQGKSYLREQELLYPDGHPEDPPFRIHVGPMATGHNLVRDQDLFNQLEQGQNRVLAMEMEASAMGLVAHLRQVPWMIVAKAAVDHAHGEKDDSFRSFAARASALFLLAFLRRLWPPLEKPGAADKPWAPEPGLFVGRQREIQKLVAGLEQGGTGVITGRLFQLEGAGGMGKTTLAREAARRLKMSFPDGAVELLAEDQPPPVLAMALANRLGEQVDEPRDDQAARSLITQLLKDRRLLLLLDNLTERRHVSYLIPDASRSAVVITTRDRDCAQFLRIQRPELSQEHIRLERFTKEEALALFRAMLGKNYQAQLEATYLAIADKLDFLPVALRPALNLMVFEPHYPAARLLARLREPELLALLAKGEDHDRDQRKVAAVFALAGPWLPSQTHRLVLAHLARCAPGPVPLDFLQAFCGPWQEGQGDLEEILEGLYARSWCERTDGTEGRAYELHALVRVVLRGQGGEELDERLVALVDRAYRQEDYLRKDRWLPQFRQALALCARRRDRRQIHWLNGYFGGYCAQRGHGNLFVHLADQVAELFPEDEVLATVYTHKGLILMNWGRLEEAYTLFEKSKDRQNLAKVYGNQALILKAWGRQEEAFTLHEKQQAICEALGDRAGLAACYGNQALILNAWGRLGEALTLHEKEQAICEALGDRAGLARCFGNQALILKAWGRLNEAFALLEKQQAICEALADRTGLAICLRNLGNLWGKSGEPKKKAEFWRRAIAINREIGIPTQDDELALKEFEKKGQ